MPQLVRSPHIPQRRGKDTLHPLQPALHGWRHRQIFRKLAFACHPTQQFNSPTTSYRHPSTGLCPSPCCAAIIRPQLFTQPPKPPDLAIKHSLRRMKPAHLGDSKSSGTDHRRRDDLHQEPSQILSSSTHRLTHFFPSAFFNTETRKSTLQTTLLP